MHIPTCTYVPFLSVNTQPRVKQSPGVRPGLEGDEAMCGDSGVRANRTARALPQRARGTGEGGSRAGCVNGAGHGVEGVRGVGFGDIGGALVGCGGLDVLMARYESRLACRVVRMGKRRTWQTEDNSKHHT